MEPKKIVIIGAGGHAKVVVDILLQQIKAGKQLDIIGILDDSYEDGQEKKIFDIPVIGKTNKVKELEGMEFVIAIGSNEVRKKIADKYSGLKYYTAIHPTAIIGERVRIGKGTVVMAGTVINPYAEVADHCILNSRSVIEHDCHIGNYSHISPNATLAGGVRVESECWIGAGSSVIQGLTIREKTIVGAGSVVVKDLPTNCIAVGAPAKAIKYKETN